MRTTRRFAVAVLVWPLLFAAGAASASGRAQALDLELPKPAMFSGAAAVETPPVGAGADYDRVLREREQARRGESGDMSNCPQAADGSERGITGSFTTGIGHSSRGGNSHWNAADINLCREYVSRAGNVNTLNMRIHVGQYDGPGYFHGPGYGPGYGPGPYGGHGMGAWGTSPPREASWSDGRRPWR
jgi:hypothetical protein